MHQSVVYVDDSFLKEAAQEPGNTAVAFEVVKWQTLPLFDWKTKNESTKKAQGTLWIKDDTLG